MTNVLKDVRPPRFLAVDFFCGAGGTTRGLIDAGGYVVAGIDKDARVERTYQENNRNITLDGRAPIFLRRDVFPRNRLYPSGEQQELMAELSAFLATARRNAAGLPLLFAICAPCQPFTTLSKAAMSDKRKKRRAKDRGLLREAARFVAMFRPEFVLSENVAGIREKKYGSVWQDFKNKLKRLGYVTGSKIVDAYKFGVPQYRKRSILIAARSNTIKKHRLTTGRELLVPESDPDAAITSVREAIGHLPALKAGQQHPHIPNHRVRGLSELNRKRLMASAPGASNVTMKDSRFGDLSLPCHRRVSKKFKTHCFGDVYMRMHPDRPAPTITTRCLSISNGRFGHFDIKQVRAISMREAAALQSFPDNYVFYPVNQLEPVARMIGNAVPPKLAHFFAEYLICSTNSRRTESANSERT